MRLYVVSDNQVTCLPHYNYLLSIKVNIAIYVDEKLPNSRKR